jgi:hypothetical protein
MPDECDNTQWIELSTLCFFKALFHLGIRGCPILLLNPC